MGRNVRQDQQGRADPVDQRRAPGCGAWALLCAQHPRTGLWPLLLHGFSSGEPDRPVPDLYPEIVTSTGWSAYQLVGPGPLPAGPVVENFEDELELVASCRRVTGAARSAPTWPQSRSTAPPPARSSWLAEPTTRTPW